MVLIVTQLGAAIARHYWLPLGLSAQYLWLGLLLIGAWYGQGVWQRRHQVVSRELGALKMQQGDWEGASAALLQCATAPEVLAEIGRASCRERASGGVVGGGLEGHRRRRER